jgi:hypothetical protein
MELKKWIRFWRKALKNVAPEHFGERLDFGSFSATNMTLLKHVVAELPVRICQIESMVIDGSNLLYGWTVDVFTEW